MHTPSGAERLYQYWLVALETHLSNPKDPAARLTQIDFLLDNPEFAAAVEKMLPSTENKTRGKRQVTLAQLRELAENPKTFSKKNERSYLLLAGLLQYEVLSRLAPDLTPNQILRKMLEKNRVGNQGPAATGTLTPHSKIALDAARKGYQAFIEGGHFPSGKAQRNPADYPAAVPPATGDGILRFSPSGKVLGPRFTEDEKTALNTARSKNSKSPRIGLGMEIGQEFQSPWDGRRYFQGKSLCQATAVAKEGTGNICRFVIASAKHCFEHILESDVIHLDGFPLIRRNQRHLVYEPAEDDFKALLVDAPCDTDVPITPLAPPGSVSGNGQPIFLDVQMKGPNSIVGKTFQTNNPNFIGINTVGSWPGIFQGDSGGPAYITDQKGNRFYAGALSMKHTAPAFQDGVGYLAAIPDWFRAGLASRRYFQPFDDGQEPYQNHQQQEYSLVNNLRSHYY